jgi:hypothetical protein
MDPSLAQPINARAPGLQPAQPDAEIVLMESATTCTCGAAIPAAASWCPRCLQPRAAQPQAVAAGHRAFAPAGPETPVPLTANGSVPIGSGLASDLPAPKPGRFAKTEASFGLFGRIVCTVLLLLPLAVFVYLAKQFVGIGGLVIYGGVIVPWALRDLWRHPARG